MCLGQVLHKIQVEEHLDVDVAQTSGRRTRRSQIRIDLLPEKQFRKELALTRAIALNCIERRYGLRIASRLGSAVGSGIGQLDQGFQT